MTEHEHEHEHDHDEHDEHEHAEELREAEVAARRAHALAQIRQYPDVALKLEAKEITGSSTGWSG
jgi:hypothetical protein